MIRKRHLRLQDVETRDRAGLEPILLILQLALQQLDRFFLHPDQRAVQENLIELLLHRRDDLIDCIAKSIVAGVALKSGRTNIAR